VACLKKIHNIQTAQYRINRKRGAEKKYMQIKLSTDYAMRCVVYLASHPGTVSAEEIGKAMHITTSYTRSILQNLKNAGFVVSNQGISGGYALKKNPRDITMYDIFSVEEASMDIDCPMEKEKGRAQIEDQYFASAAMFYNGLQNLISGYLKKITLSDIINRCPANKEADIKKRSA